MRPAQFLSSVLFLTALSAASAPWSESWHLKAVRDIENVLFERADSSATSAAASTAAAASSTGSDSDSDSSAKTTATAKTTAKSSAPGSGSDSASASASDSASASGSGSSASGSAAATSGDSSASSGSATGKSSKGTSTSKKSDASTKTYGNSVGYGGVTMITPNVYSSASYYRVGEKVTFAWNYTSLSVTPSAVDILATCTANQGTYTLALNQSINGSTGAVTWDTGEYQATATLPLLTETYTLIIHDAAVAVSGTPSYGHLAAYSQHTFGVYTPQPYSNTSGNDTEVYTCVTCKNAASSLERQTMGALCAIVAIVVTTFTVFTGGVGVLF